MIHVAHRFVYNSTQRARAGVSTHLRASTRRALPAAAPIAPWTPTRGSITKSDAQIPPQRCLADDAGERTACRLLHDLRKLHEQSRREARHGSAQHVPQVLGTRPQERREATVVAGLLANSEAAQEEVAQPDSPESGGRTLRARARRVSTPPSATTRRPAEKVRTSSV